MKKQEEFVAIFRKFKCTKTTLLLFLLLVSGLIYLIYFLHLSFLNNDHARLISNAGLDRNDPWNGTPEFVLYVRLTTGDRWVREYREVLIRTMRLFFPSDRANLIVVLDDEKSEDHYLGAELKKEWPHPSICYMNEGDRSLYHNKGKSRMYWDMFYLEKCTRSQYVGFIDTDTFFSTMVTPNLLFENGKPVIIAKIGKPNYVCWETATEMFLKKKEALQCMSAFPIMVKTEHVVEMRDALSKQHGKSFDALFRDIPIQAGHALCLCQFSVMCNYFWYFHRDEYSWHIQVVPKGHVKKSHLLPSMQSLSYYRKMVTPELRIPLPRSAIHIRYIVLHGIKFDKQEPPQEVLEGYIRESLCYAGGFTYCKESCKMYNERKLHQNLFAFEFYDWAWDKRCIYQQKKHYENVRKSITYFIEKRKEIFGLSSIEDLCPLIESHEPYR